MYRRLSVWLSFVLLTAILTGCQPSDSGAPAAPRTDIAAQAQMSDAIKTFSADLGRPPTSIRELLESKHLDRVPSLAVGLVYDYNPFTGGLSVREGRPGEPQIPNMEPLQRAQLPSTGQDTSQAITNEVLTEREAAEELQRYYDRVARVQAYNQRFDQLAAAAEQRKRAAQQGQKTVTQENVRPIPPLGAPQQGYGQRTYPQSGYRPPPYTSPQAQPPSIPRDSGQKTVNVRGYYRKDGTYVRPHTRTPPSR